MRWDMYDADWIICHTSFCSLILLLPFFPHVLWLAIRVVMNEWSPSWQRGISSHYFPIRIIALCAVFFSDSNLMKGRKVWFALVLFSKMLSSGTWRRAASWNLICWSASRCVWCFDSFQVSWHFLIESLTVYVGWWENGSVISFHKDWTLLLDLKMFTAIILISLKCIIKLFFLKLTKCNL